MNPLSGYISIPHRSDFKAQVGSFFSATIVSNPKPGIWLIQVGNTRFEAFSEVKFQIGQKISLQVVKSDSAVKLQIVQPRASDSNSQQLGPLVSTFMSQGLPLVSERLKFWERKLALSSQTSSDHRWAAQIESKSPQEAQTFVQLFQDWIDWERCIEQGLPSKAPEEDSEERFDLWNARKSQGTLHEIVIPLNWSWKDRIDRGLLRAQYPNAQPQLVSWNLTAVAAEIPFRLSAKFAQKDNLELSFRLFRKTDYTIFEKDINLIENILNSASSRIKLKIFGPGDQEEPHVGWKSIDEIV